MKKNSLENIKICSLVFILVFLFAPIMQNKARIDTNTSVKFIQNSEEIETNWLWGDIEVISKEIPEDQRQSVSAFIDNLGNINVIWEDRYDYFGTGGKQDIFFMQWNKITKEWSDISLVPTGSELYPQHSDLVIDNYGNRHIVWVDQTVYDNDEAGMDTDICHIFYNESTGIWSEVSLISTGSTDNSWNAKIAIDLNNNLHVTWDDRGENLLGSGEDTDVFYRSWNFGSNTWNDITLISDESTEASWMPYITCNDKGDVYLAWNDNTNFLGLVGDDSDIFCRIFNVTTQTWGPHIFVSSESSFYGFSYKPIIQIDEAYNIHFIWMDYSDNLPGDDPGVNYDIVYRYWNISTDSWSSTELVSIGSTENMNLYSFAIEENGNLHVLWTDITDNLLGSGSDTDIFLRTRESQTASWNDVELFSRESTKSSNLYDIKLDQEGNLHIFYQDSTDIFGAGPDTDIFYRKLQKNTRPVGEELSTTEIISVGSNASSSDSTIVGDSQGNIHIVWSDDDEILSSGIDKDLFYKRWSVSAQAWSPTELISTVSDGISWEASMVVDSDDNLHLVWVDLADYNGSGGSTYDIFYRNWTISDSSWSTTELVTTESINHARQPSLVVDYSDNLHLCYSDQTDYNSSGSDYDIFYKFKNKGSQYWSTPTVVSINSSGDTQFLSLSIDYQENLHVSWSETGSYGGSGSDVDVFYNYRLSSTPNWTNTQLVSTVSSGTSSLPHITVDSKLNVHIFWVDYTDYLSSGGDADIFYRRWDYISSSWTVIEVISTDSSSTSSSPSTCIDSSGKIYLFWSDVNGSDYDIVYQSLNVDMSSWSDVRTVSTESTGPSNAPSCFIDSNDTIHITWSDHTDYSGSGVDMDIFYKKIFIMHPVLTPVLYSVPSDISDTGDITVYWSNILYATEYYLYRSLSYIDSVESLTPLAIVTMTSLVDQSLSDGIYYYAIVAYNRYFNSSISNIISVTIDLIPVIPEFSLTLNTLLLSLLSGILVIFLIRRKKN